MTTLRAPGSVHPAQARRLGFIALLVQGMLLFVGCAAGHVDAAAPADGLSANGTAGMGTVHLSLIVPPQSAMRSRKYVSPSTAALAVVVTQEGSTARPPLTFPCSVASCNATFLAPVGNDTIALTLADATTGGNALSISKATPITVHATGINSVSLTTDPVVATAAVKLGSSVADTATTDAGTAADVPVTVQAFDADGNLIVGPGDYVDRSGTPVTLTLQTAHASAGGAGNVTLNGATQFTAPGAAATTAHYNGRWMQSSSFTVSSSSTLVARQPATLTIKPHAQEFLIAGSPNHIVAGPDGKLWFPEFAANRVARIATDGTGYAEFSCGTCIGPTGIAVGADGNLWTTNQGNGTVSVTSTSGALVATIPVVSNLIKIISAPDGYVYYSAQVGHALGKISTAGVVQNFPTPGNDHVHGLGYGPDGNIWYLDTSANLIGTMTTSGVYLASWPVPGLSVGFPDGVVAGPDGNVWFTVYSRDVIGKITSAGVITSYQLRHGASPSAIVVGPDGALWFGESGSGVGRLTTAGTLTEYGAESGFTHGAGSVGVGPDGNIWLGSTNTITKFIF